MQRRPVPSAMAAAITDTRSSSQVPGDQGESLDRVGRPFDDHPAVVEEGDLPFGRSYDDRLPVPVKRRGAGKAPGYGVEVRSLSRERIRVRPSDPEFSCAL